MVWPDGRPRQTCLQSSRHTQRHVPFLHPSDRYPGTKKSGSLPNIRLGGNLLLLFSVRCPQAAGITEVRSEHRMLSICYQITYWGLRDGGFKPFLLHFHHSRSMDAKRGSVNSTSLLTSGHFYFQLREIVQRPELAWNPAPSPTSGAITENKRNQLVSKRRDCENTERWRAAEFTPKCSSARLPRLLPWSKLQSLRSKRPDML